MENLKTKEVHNQLTRYFVIFLYDIGRLNQIEEIIYNLLFSICKEWCLMNSNMLGFHNQPMGNFHVKHRERVVWNKRELFWIILCHS